MGRITFLGNFQVDYSSESQYVKTLEAMGYQLICLQEGEATGEEVLEYALQSSLFIWVHTHGWVTPGQSMEEILRLLRDSDIPTMTYHLDLWLGLDRQKDLNTDPFYQQIEHFFATDSLMADWFNENSEVKGHFLPAGVYDEECVMLEGDLSKDVVFVGSKGYHPEWPYRPQLLDWLQDTYGDRFGHYSGEEGALGLKRGLHLNQLLADTKIVVGDSLCLGFTYPYYISDRIFEITGRGGFLIMPHIEGIDDLFEDGKEIVTYEYGDFKQLEYLIDYYLEHDAERERIRKAGFERTKRDHTYANRWDTILGELGL